MSGADRMRVILALASMCWSAILVLPLVAFLEQYAQAATGDPRVFDSGGATFLVVPMTVVAMFALWRWREPRGALAASVMLCGWWVTAAIFAITAAGFLSGFAGAHGGGAMAPLSRAVLVGVPTIGITVICGVIVSAALDRPLRRWWYALVVALVMTVSVPAVRYLAAHTPGPVVRLGGDVERRDVDRTTRRFIQTERGREQLWNAVLDPSTSPQARTIVLERLLPRAYTQHVWRVTQAAALVFTDGDPYARGRFVANYWPGAHLWPHILAERRADAHPAVRALIALLLLDKRVPWPGAQDNLLDLLRVWPTLEPPLKGPLRECIIDAAATAGRSDPRLTAQLEAMRVDPASGDLRDVIDKRLGASLSGPSGDCEVGPLADREFPPDGP